MPLFEVMVPQSGADPLESELVRDRFSFGAALLPPIWALMHGLWLEMFGWIVGLVLIIVAGLFVGGTAAFWLYVLFALWFGSAASDLRIAALARSGYRDAGARVAADDMMAEHDFIVEQAP